MRNSRSFFTGILVGGAIFVLCNLAGYVLVNYLGPAYLQPTEAVDSVAEGTAPEVVSFSTPTVLPAPLESAPTVSIGTPLPLLPTVTPGAPPPAAPTQTPLPSPEATPTQAPRDERALAARGLDFSDQLEILSHRSYVDDLGWHHIVGEVHNKSDLPLEYVEVVAKLYDITGDVIGTKLTFTAPSVIYPGGKAPFDLITLRRSQWSRIADYALRVEGDVATDLLDEQLVLVNQNSWIEEGNLFVQGEVQNTGESSALVKLVVTLYDAQQNVVNTNWSYADRGILATGDISSFLVKIDHETDPDNYSYRIQIEEETVEEEN